MDLDWCEDIADLQNLLDVLEKESGFEHERIQVYQDDNGTYGIEIDKQPYSTYITVEEADGTLRDIFYGIRLGKGEV